MEKKHTASYFDKLLNSKASKKQIALYLDEATIERIDTVVRVFSSISDAKSFSRNTLIETAIDKFLEDAGQYLLEEQDIDIHEIIEEERSARFDTVIFSSTGSGFEDTFLGQRDEMGACWYPCKIKDERIPNVKYIAIYRSKPHSAITHYAKVKEFVYDEAMDCKVCYFDGDPHELPHKVPLGNQGNCFFRGGRANYTTLECLLNAETTDQLIFG